MPSKCHIGQKLMKLVTKRIAATINKITARVPEIILVKYNTTMAAAITILTVLSTDPIFGFIVYFFK